ncbi:MAG: TonB-dependent receptor plug domain-containing protein, partial [Pseudomonadota bacterium]|nr:TonB-dependent receptor plug domain-containing protein [Pseudomonadota bacterium]
MKITHIPYKNHKLSNALALIVVGWSGTTLPVNASEAKFTLEEIVVTAQRREESLQDVPMSVTAITESFMQDSRIDHVADVVDYTPGLTGAAAGVLTQKYAIRGISSSQDVGISGSSSVGVFSDGSYLGKELAALAFIDTAQVEVLKGPQGSLFGRNTSAGAINITTNKPNADSSLSVGQSVGRFDSGSYSYKTTLVANQALIEDTLFVRASLLREDDDAYIDNEFLNREVGGNEGLSGRVRLKYLPAPDLEIEVDLMSADRRTLGTPTEIEVGNSLLSLANGAGLALNNGLDYGIDVLGLPHSLPSEFITAFAPAAGLTPDLFDSKLARDTRSKEVLRANVAGFDIKWDFNEYNTLTLRTSYGETSAASLSDIDATPINL